MNLKLLIIILLLGFNIYAQNYNHLIDRKNAIIRESKIINANLQQIKKNKKITLDELAILDRKIEKSGSARRNARGCWKLLKLSDRV